jgi:hypothetical protein
MMKELCSLVFLLSCFFVSRVAFASGPPVTLAGPTPGVTSSYSVGTTNIIIYTITNNVPQRLPLTVSGISAPLSRINVPQDCGGNLPPSTSCQVGIAIAPQPLNVGQAFNQTILFNYQGRTALTSNIRFFVTAAQTSILGNILQPLPLSMNVGNSAPVQFTFTNAGSFDATRVGINSQGSSAGWTLTSDTCSNATLTSDTRCSVAGIFTPQQAGVAQVQLTLTSINSGPVALVSRSNISPLPPAHVVGQIIQTLPALTHVQQSYPVQLQWRNSGRLSATGMSVNKNYPAGFSETQDTCGTTLAPGVVCTIGGIFTPLISKINSSATLVATLNDSGGEQVPLSITTTIHAAVSGRTVLFINQCSVPIWLGLSGADVHHSCNSDSDCPQGASCALATKECFWSNPAPEDGHYLLAPQGGKNTVIVPDTSPIVVNGQAQIWSGTLAGRMGCDLAHSPTGTCATAACGENSNSMACNVGQTFIAPATQVALTLVNQPSIADDHYQLSLQQGFNVPIQVSAVNATLNPNDPYFCESPGSPAPTNSKLGACSWTMTPPQTNLIAVAADALACQQTLDCVTPGDVCGLSYNSARTPQVQKTCGAAMGFWTAASLCNITHDKSADTYFQCSTPLLDPIFPPALHLTNNDLYNCHTHKVNPNDPTSWVLDSCYNTDDPTCCGCVDWDQAKIPVPPAPSTAQCVGHNQLWHDQVLPTLAWLKQACPTSAVYPFDDKSSTFHCQVPDPKISDHNVANYTITFCPK